MPRKARRAVGGMVYHVLNRANSRRRLFASDWDYEAFLKALAEAIDRYSVKLLAFAIMPNHWHLVVVPMKDAELSTFMRWLTQTHTQRWRHAKKTVGYGALYQGRYKAFVVQEDFHFLVLCRYVERNALRAKFVERAEQWRWSSAWARLNGDEKLKGLLSDWPVDRPRNWNAILNDDQSKGEEKQVQVSILRSRPLGTPAWVRKTARRLGVEQSVHEVGRPRKQKTR